MSEVTQLLREWNAGEPEARDRLMRLVYDPLHAIAERHFGREREGHTLQPTALVNELYVRFADQRQVAFRDRVHFFAVAATVMRRILAGAIELPPHHVLVRDFHATVRDGSAARVAAPHIDADRADGCAEVRAVLRRLLEASRGAAPKGEAEYLDLVGRVIETGSLSERIRHALRPHEKAADEDFTGAARHLYIELMDCLEANEPWQGRGL